MQKKLNKIIEIHCEEDQKLEIKDRIYDYLVDNYDYKNGYVLLNSDRFEFVDVIIFEGCENVDEITRVVTF